MHLSEFDYELPPELIAQEPAPERDASRLLVLHRQSGAMEHRGFSDLPEYLRPGDVMIVNETKVVPARLFGVFEDGKSVEVLLMHSAGGECWNALVKPAKRARTGRRLILACGHLEATVVAQGIHGRRVLQVPSDIDLRAILRSYGVVPLPPYIKRSADRLAPLPAGGQAGSAEDGEPGAGSREPRAEQYAVKQSAESREPRAEPQRNDRGSRLTAHGSLDWERYQTVFAREEGAVAAPTAGLHFTPLLLDRLRGLGVLVHPITLHVGPGTFQPVRVEDVSRHRMELERYTIPEATASAIKAARTQGGRVIAVGTTSVRTLESAADGSGIVRAGAGEADLFIRPGYAFRVVDGLVTNFHLPRSTLLMLVTAFAGQENIRRSYAEAIRRRYRFYSYGDAMLIL
jgi:S-adenosylmethionine:tRNA ribosyltransferase-isomerase